ncbi:FAD-binding oxidoreductase [Streptomyces olivaceiscleroticus]|uniref:FAD-binding oxidoreductase n=1 Tax=Streptomyces olivaceiscleroticus TaxID=68245 RepID=A0ABN1BCJ5_9ACTN
MTGPLYLDALRRALPGRVLGLDSVPGVDNGRVRLVPACTVRPGSADDIGTALRFARDEGLPLTVRGGGHSTAGYCLNRTGVVLDMSSMRGVRLDADRQTVRVGGGARWQDIHPHLRGDRQGLIAVGCSSPQVGVAGALLGGGLSFTSRAHGLGSDNVTAIELVLADGARARVEEHSISPADRELFWACRGGGGGNFGVVTAMELRLHRPRTEHMFGGQIVFPLRRAPEILPLYGEWTAALPDTLAAYLHISNRRDTHERTRRLWAMTVTVIHDGAREEATELLRPLLTAGPLRAWSATAPLHDWEARVGAASAVAQRLAYIRSGVLPVRAFTTDFVNTVCDFMPRSPSPESFLLWIHTGGRMATAPDAGAYPHRNSGSIYELKSIWRDEAAARANVTWAYDFGEALRPHSTGAYVNQHDPLLTGWRTAYHGPHYDRLVAVKRRVDPTRVLRFPQAIGSTYEPPGTSPPDLHLLDPDPARLRGR